MVGSLLRWNGRRPARGRAGRRVSSLLRALFPGLGLALVDLLGDLVEPVSVPENLAGHRDELLAVLVGQVLELPCAGRASVDGGGHQGELVPELLRVTGLGAGRREPLAGVLLSGHCMSSRLRRKVDRDGRAPAPVSYTHLRAHE